MIAQPSPYEWWASLSDAEQKEIMDSVGNSQAVSGGTWFAMRRVGVVGPARDRVPAALAAHMKPPYVQFVLRQIADRIT